MSRYSTLTIGEIKNLSDEQIEEMALEVGNDLMKDQNTRDELARFIGSNKIRNEIRKLKEIQEELTGTQTPWQTSTN